jgi:Predicted membrane protein (DUF2339)
MDTSFWLAILVMTVAGLLFRVASLHKRIRGLEETLRDNEKAGARDAEAEVARFVGFERRIQTLERQIAGLDPGRRVEPPAPAPLPAVTPAPAVSSAAAAQPPVRVALPGSPIPTLPLGDQARRTGLRADTVTEVPPAAPPAAPAAPRPSEAAESWELVVGTSWLNKLGVLVFVIGVALLVGYSIAHVGPAGRVLIGYLLSAALLVGGVVLERREPYRTYAYGLIAGGWAGIYFTAYAMHALDAARIVESPLVGTLCLAAVATGMIAHSLMFRSQATTALAYVVAYATLVLTPLTGFSLVASVPLAISVLVVGQRFGWSNVSALGLASTYLLFVVRGHGPGDALLDPQSATPYLMLGTYWLTFEIADLTTLRRSGPAVSPLFALNAIGVLGAGFTELPSNDAGAWSWFLAGVGAAYLVAAIVRARFVPPPSPEPGDTAPRVFTSAHGAVCLAAALAAGSASLRFSGPREVLALLVEAELLVGAGIVLHDVYVRWVGAATGILVTVSAWTLAAGPASVMSGWPGAPLTFTPAVALVAAAWYANREWIGRQSLRPGWVEYGYSWAASALGLLLIVREFAPRHVGLPALVMAAVLVEAGLRRAREYRGQAYLAVAVATLFLVILFGIDRRVPPADVWLILPAAVAITAWLAFRLHAWTPPSVELRLAAGSLAGLATLLLAILEWQVASPDAVGPVWTVSAVVLLMAGARWRVAGLRFLAYAWAFVGAMRSFRPIAAPGPATAGEVAWMGVVIALLFAASLISRRMIRASSGGPGADGEDVIRLGLSVTASILLAALIVVEVRPTVVTLAWGLEGLGLLAAGFLGRERVLRLSGLALLFVCILKLFVYDLSALAPLPRIFSFVVLGLVLLAVSWTYTRYREQIRRYL